MLRSTSIQRRSRGFTLLVAVGVVAVVTLAVMLSYSVVGREADTQADSRRQKEAFFAAEAGLAEGRETMRLRLEQLRPSELETYGSLAAYGAVTAEEGLGDAARPWYEILPGAGAGGWNYLRLTPDALSEAERSNEDGEPYASYPVRDNVRYRVFVRDDVDVDLAGNVDGSSDGNGQVWVISVGEVENPNGRPTRSVVQALVRYTSTGSPPAPGTPQSGCDAAHTYDCGGEGPVVLTNGMNNL